MRIESGSQPNPPGPSSRSAPAAGMPQNALEATGDAVDISRASMRVAVAQQAAIAAADVRGERVEELRQSIANGTYTVDSAALARVLLNQV